LKSSSNSINLKEVRKMGDKDKEAYWKGYSDCKRHAEAGEKEGISHDISDLLGPGCYQPPAGHEVAYRQGWKDAEREKKDDS
jgi:hypothetical protein